jgi:hypothetical protein
MCAHPRQNPILTELDALAPDLLPVLDQRDAASRLMTILGTRYTPAQVAQPPGDRAWELAALYFFNSGRVHKGMPLVWISDCFSHLGFPVHAKRYLMLTLCEDALREKGFVSPDNTGVYFRLVWGQGLPDEELRRCAAKFFELAEEKPMEALFPEVLLQRKDWASPADFTVMAKFCRVLDSTKSRFGVLFSRNGISSAGNTQFAEREQLKVFQDRGIVIVVLGLADLERVASGANHITLLRRQYETVRLDLRAQNRAA